MFSTPANDPAAVPFFITNTYLGRLEFEINPSEYDVYPAPDYELVANASGAYTVATPLYDNVSRKMVFQELTENFFHQLERYAELDDTFRIRQSNFTDGNFGAYVATPVKVLRVEGTPINGEMNYAGPMAGTISGVHYKNVNMEFVVDA